MAHEYPSVSKKAKVSGWGCTNIPTNGNAYTYSRILKYIEVEVIEKTDCNNQFGISLEDGQICARSINSNAIISRVNDFVSVHVFKNQKCQWTQSSKIDSF